MNDKDYIDQLVEKARIAQLAIEEYTQEETDALVKAIGKAIFDNKEILSREAVDETRMGIYQSKVRKHENVVSVIWNYLKDKKSVGIIDDDPIKKVITIAKPMGVIACITPSTNPTTTAAANTMHAVKSRNAVIVAPHPRAKKCTLHAVNLMREAIVALGAPADLIQTLEDPSIEQTGLLMAAADAISATGGAAMVKAANSSGKPSYGVGQGNVQCIVDEKFADLDLLATNVDFSRGIDYGMPCAGEQTMFVPRSRKDEIIAAFKAKGDYVLTDPKIVETLEQKFFINGEINRDVVGKPPKEAFSVIGIDIPETRIVLVELQNWKQNATLCREIMLPILRYIVYDKFEDAVKMAKANLIMEGAGHTAIIYSDDDNNINYAGMHLPVGRLLVGQIGPNSGGCTYVNGLDPCISLGCGTWGNNSICENFTYRHMLNITKIAYTIPNAYAPSYEETWG